MWRRILCRKCTFLRHAHFTPFNFLWKTFIPKHILFYRCLQSEHCRAKLPDANYSAQWRSRPQSRIWFLILYEIKSTYCPTTSGSSCIEIAFFCGAFAVISRPKRKLSDQGWPFQTSYYHKLKARTSNLFIWYFKNQKKKFQQKLLVRRSATQWWSNTVFGQTHFWSIALLNCGGMQPSYWISRWQITENAQHS